MGFKSWVAFARVTAAEAEAPRGSVARLEAEVQGEGRSAPRLWKGRGSNGNFTNTSQGRPKISVSAPVHSPIPVAIPGEQWNKEKKKWNHYSRE